MEDENVAISLCLIIIASVALRIRHDKRRPRRWARACLHRRRQFGAHHALMKELASEDSYNFRNFIQIYKQDFDNIILLLIQLTEPLNLIFIKINAFFCICWHFCFFPFFPIIRKIFGT